MSLGSGCLQRTQHGTPYPAVHIQPGRNPGEAGTGGSASPTPASCAVGRGSNLSHRELYPPSPHASLYPLPPLTGCPRAPPSAGKPVGKAQGWNGPRFRSEPPGRGPPARCRALPAEAERGRSLPRVVPRTRPVRPWRSRRRRGHRHRHGEERRHHGFRERGAAGAGVRADSGECRRPRAPRGSGGQRVPGVRGGTPGEDGRFGAPAPLGVAVPMSSAVPSLRYCRGVVAGQGTVAGGPPHSSPDGRGAHLSPHTQGRSFSHALPPFPKTPHHSGGDAHPVGTPIGTSRAPFTPCTVPGPSPLLSR